MSIDCIFFVFFMVIILAYAPLSVFDCRHQGGTKAVQCDSQKAKRKTVGEGEYFIASM